MPYWRFIYQDIKELYFPFPHTWKNNMKNWTKKQKYIWEKQKIIAENYIQEKYLGQLHIRKYALYYYIGI